VLQVLQELISINAHLTVTNTLSYHQTQKMFENRNLSKDMSKMSCFINIIF